MANDADPVPPSIRIEDLVARASPGGDFAARQVLANLEARLFNRRRDPVHVAHYIIEQRLGAGGSGTVYRAYDPQKDRKVALKLLHASDGARQQAAQARLLREAQALAKIDHPNVVKVYDVGTYDASVFDPTGAAKHAREPAVYVAMELVEGHTLDVWLRMHNPTWREIQAVYVQAAWGLVAAHERGMAHRDFKPANVLVSLDADKAVQRVVVLDFGLARAIEKQADDGPHGLAHDADEHLKRAAAPMDATLTVPGTLLGTPAYMAPEQHARGRGTAKSDQYALCLALYEAWYGHSPFFADNERALALAKDARDIMPPPTDSPVPPHLFDALLRGLAAKPEERHASVRALVAALRAEPRRKRWRWVAAGGLGLAAVVTTWVLVSASEPCDPGHDSTAAQWDDASGARLAARMAAQSVPYARTTADRVVHAIAVHAHAWDDAWTAACAVEPAREPGVRRRCLQQRDTTLGILVTRLMAIDSDAMPHAVSAVTGLPDPTDCLRTPLPWDFAARAGPVVTQALARSEVFGRLGDDASATRAAREALTSAQADGDAQAAAIAAVRLGSALAHQDESTEAVQMLSGVLWGASGVEDRALAALAATRLVALGTNLPTPHSDAPLWTQRARAWVSDLPTPARISTLVVLGHDRVARGEVDLGRRDLATAEALLQSLPSPPPLLHIDVARAQAEAALAAGDAAAATQRLRAAATAVQTAFGPDHPQMGLTLRALARAEAANGMRDAADRDDQQATAILDAALPPGDPQR